jgi:two-component system, cell cycle sensor histidine kinase and response regulator CckA
MFPARKDSKLLPDLPPQATVAVALATTVLAIGTLLLHDYLESTRHGDLFVGGIATVLFVAALFLAFTTLRKIRYDSAAKRQTQLFEAELQESEQRYRLVTDLISDYVYTVGRDSEGNFIPTWISDSFTRVSGYTFEEIAGPRRLFLYVHPDDHGRLRRHYRTVMVGRPDVCDLRIVTKSGDTRWVVNYAKLVDQEDANGTILIGAAQDITDRKEAENALRESSERLRSLFENSTIGIYRTTPEGEILLANPALAKMMGHGSIIDLMKRNVANDGYADQATRATFRETVERDGMVTGFEATWRRADGSFMYVRESSRVERDEDGNVLYYEGTVEDITDRFAAQTALKSSEAQFRTLVSSLDDIVFMMDNDLRYVSVYGNWLSRNGMVADQITGKPLGEVFADSDETTLLLEEKYRLALEGKHVIFDWETMLPDHHDITHFSTSISPILGEHETVEGIVGVTRDTSEQTSLQERLHHAQKMEAIGRLAGSIAHDFNNNLTVIGGYAELLTKRLKADDPARAQLSEISRAADRSADLTTRLLTFSRKEVVQPRVVRPNDLMSELRRLLTRVVVENIHIEFKAQQDLPNIRIDTRQFDQIMLNLVANARDAMQSGGQLAIEAHTSVIIDEGEDEGAQIDAVEFVVTDTGVGMDSYVRSKIFEPFYTTKGEKGTGLGLATVYGIVQQNNGTISCESEIGEGTSFRISFPTVDEKAHREKLHPVEREQHGSGLILLVEDEPGILDVAMDALSEHGYTVFCATTGREALQIAQTIDQTLDLLLTDVILPDTNGVDLSKQIAEIFPGIGIVYASGYERSVITRHGALDEKTFFMQKPYSMTDMLGYVRAALEARTKQ